jgi:hypothetical protein
MTLSIYQAALANQVKDVSGFGATEQNEAIGLAMSEHSRHKPLIVVEDVTGDGTRSYTLSDVLGNWNDFSQIQEIVYPVDDDYPPNPLTENDDYRISETPDGQKLFFLTCTPASTEEFRIRYTAIHTCMADACSVPSADTHAVQLLASAYYCEIVSNYYAQSADSLISADSVNHQSKSQQYASRAKALRNLYYQHIGIGDKQKPSSHNQDWDVTGPFGTDRLIRKNRYR